MTRGLSLLSLLALAASLYGQSAPAAVVRLHHLHYRTDNVTAALADGVRLYGGTRVLLQGLGVGVRAGDHYLLFDVRSALENDGGTASVEPGSDVAHERDVEGRYRTALKWLNAKGIAVTPSDLALTRLAAPVPDAALDHIAFATGNLESAIEALRGAGTVPARRTDDTVYFRGDGLIIEITRDTDLPDVLWCPMHPDVRAGSPGKCPICAMDLVPIPPPRVGQYRVDVTPVPGPRGRGARGLTLRIADPQSGEPVMTFAPLHERLVHLFIVSRDLRFFAHDHPVQKGEVFDLAIDLAPGAYMMIADFLPLGGSPQMVHRAVVTPGAAVSLFAEAVTLVEDLADKVVDGIRMQLTVDVRPGRLDAVLRFRFTDASTGSPIANLQPYLGASGHLLIVSPDLTHGVHAHPESVTSGPDINFAAEFPSAGVYKLWVQVQRDGKVFTAPFVVRVG
jgi:hypothetical protein